MDDIQLPRGIPLRIPVNQKEVDDLCMEGPSVSFVLGGTKKGQPKVFKVVRNLIGAACVEANEADLGLAELTEKAWFLLPPIPMSLVEKMDIFFRTVDKERGGSEAIVLLTYDPSFREQDNASEGWGILVPKQENNAAHCKYDHASVADEKDENVLIVGTCHSHPGMSAFASHTDHGDQADFDGIHITFGWSKNSSRTEYHIELQYSGTNFTLKPEIAFEQYVDPLPFPELEDWLKKVTKAATSYGKTSTSNFGSAGTTGYQRQITLPSGVPDPKKNTVIIDVRSGEASCPACKYYFKDENRDRRRCDGCECFILLPGENPEDIIDHRIKKNYPVTELLDEYWWWKRHNGKDEVEQVGKAQGS